MGCEDSEMDQWNRTESAKLALIVMVNLLSTQMMRQLIGERLGFK
jgi:hypothetical protein